MGRLKCIDSTNQKTTNQTRDKVSYTSQLKIVVPQSQSKARAIGERSKDSSKIQRIPFTLIPKW